MKHPAAAKARPKRQRSRRVPASCGKSAWPLASAASASHYGVVVGAVNFPQAPLPIRPLHSRYAEIELSHAAITTGEKPKWVNPVRVGARAKAKPARITVTVRRRRRRSEEH